MRYYVFGFDDRMYGPEEITTIQSWATEGRVTHDTKLRNADTGEETTYGQLIGAFKAPPSVAAAPYQSYQVAATTAAKQASNGYFVWAMIDSVGAVLLFFVLHGIGIIFAAYGVYNGYMAFKTGHKWGVVALVVSILSVLAVGAGWVLRIGSR